MCKDKKEKSIVELLGITPGPWRVGCDLDSINTDYHEDGKNWNRLNCSSNGFAKCIAKIKRPKWMKPFESMNNANLIAAAPEMIDDLIESCLVIERYKRTSPYFLKADEEVLNRKIKIIEKACYPKTWEDIQCLKK